MYPTPRTSHRLAELVEDPANRDSKTLIGALQAGCWTTPRLIDLLRHGAPDVARAAATCLGAMGGMSAAPALAEALRRPDAHLVRVAEHALWSVGFRAGGVEAQAELFEILCCGNDDGAEWFIERFSRLIRNYPVYGEAYHQRAMAHHARHDFLGALRDYRRAFHLNPYHFAARAGQGYCEWNLGRYRRAMWHFLAVRELHPRYEGVRQAIRQLRDLHHAALSSYPGLDGAGDSADALALG